MTNGVAKAGREGLAGEVAAIHHLARTDLLDRWRLLYGSEPPRRISSRLLRGAIAYRLQERALGGLKTSTRRLLLRAADGVVRGGSIVHDRKLKPGTRLLREWQGVTHEVIVLDDGVLFRGERHRSLSEVARAITGSRWSGPRFFGLNAPEKR